MNSNLMILCNPAIVELFTLVRPETLRHHLSMVLPNVLVIKVAEGGKFSSVTA